MRIARITGYVLCSLMLIYIAISLIGPGTFQLSASFMKSFLIVSWIANSLAHRGSLFTLVLTSDTLSIVIYLL